MILFFEGSKNIFFAVKANNEISTEDIHKLQWLFGNASIIQKNLIDGTFVGPRKEMITPWSTNAVEITQNMGIKNISRIEQFEKTADQDPRFDPMLKAVYSGLNQEIFTISKEPDPIVLIDDIAAYNEKEGLALSPDEIEYLEKISDTMGRKLTDSEIFGFSQANSEHCRHKIFNGTFIIDGTEKEKTLFQLIRETTQKHKNTVVSAYKDNCAFLQGPDIELFAPARQDGPDFFNTKSTESVISLKAETHNFPTTVEPFNGAATGTGGEIRDRIAGGKASFPLAGTAVYMTSYSRLEDGEKEYEQETLPRPWLYQTPEQILIKASNGASDFGNKFGQPLICGSVLTFEHFENNKKYGYDKVIMLAGGIGFARKVDSLKDKPNTGDQVILLGGDNYRIGMGGGAVSSVATGEFDNAIELNAVQRSNPEMQKRVYNAIRAMGETSSNPIVSIHDHGAGGHLNCLSELVEDTGGTININKLPIGDPTLSLKEVIGNESQERMGLIIKKSDVDILKKVAERERAPFYEIGETTGDMQFTFETEDGKKPIDMKLEYLFGKPPKTVMNDKTVPADFEPVEYEQRIHKYLNEVLQLESVACKDWLTNKVDRSVTGRVAKQQTAGSIQLPLNNLGVSALDYRGEKGVATSIGHAPVSAMISPANGSILSIAEALTNIIWAPINGGLKGISLSANWMWPCKNEGEDARLYEAVEAASDFSKKLGINIPTGKDSLSMTQKYKNGDKVYSPGTVIISAAGEVSDLKKIVEPVINYHRDTHLLFIDFSKCQPELGGSSFAQVVNRIGLTTPTVKDPEYFVKAFNLVQILIEESKIIAGHDVSAGGMITTLLEMTFANNDIGLNLDFSNCRENDLTRLLFSENPGIIIQVSDSNEVERILSENDIHYKNIGFPVLQRRIKVTQFDHVIEFDIDALRDTWYKTSYLLDRKQSGKELALERFNNYKKQDLMYAFKNDFKGTFKEYEINPDHKKTGIKAAIIREKGVNGDREMAYSMFLAGMDVKDVHMTDLISGRETLEDINYIVFVGGFSNSDVLGSAKGWAGAFLYNPKAKEALDKFYAREDTLSLGVCNGCQLMIELGLVTGQPGAIKMEHNNSGKFESSFLSVNIPENNSVMLGSMAGQQLGIWVAHGEGRFNLSSGLGKYNEVLKYTYSSYPGNPNGSDKDMAGICSENGRHLAMMPHLERAVLPWQWAFYPKTGKGHEVTPWIEAFVNAREWIKNKMN